jgi:hypothetical protein
MPKKVTSKKSSVSATQQLARKRAKKTAASAPVVKKVSAVVPAVPTHTTVPVSAPSVKTPAETTWEQIKNLPVQLFGLPNQTVSTISTPAQVEPSKLYLTIRASAALPAIEAAIAPTFEVKVADKYLVVERVVAPLTAKK